MFVKGAAEAHLSQLAVLSGKISDLRCAAGGVGGGGLHFSQAAPRRVRLVRWHRVG
jgi:hypothetical protein